MKTIRIKFVDFWPDFDVTNNSFINALSHRYDVQMSEEPEYVFYSCFGFDHLEYEESIRIFVTLEAVVPDFNLCDYSISCDYIDFDGRHLRVSDYSFQLLKERSQPRTISEAEKLLMEKTEFCNFIYSNSNAHPARDRFFHLLNRYRKVDSLGKHLYNMGDDLRDFYKTRQGSWFDTSVEQKSRYKFSLAFENARHEGYTTEKIVSSLIANTIPIYWGDPMVGRIYNREAMISCHDFESFDDVVREVIRIDRNERLWVEKAMQDPLTKRGREELENYQPRIDRFLFKIFDCPLEQARRRASGSWNRIVNDRWRELAARKGPGKGDRLLEKARTYLRRFRSQISRGPL